MKNIFFALLILSPLLFSAQENKNSLYASWGYNRGWYTNSDIHFSGEGYDFTLWNTPARDSPEPFEVKTYLNPVRFTIPQFNFRAGYFLKEKYSLSFGWDHMKYFMRENIYVNITGHLEEGAHDYYEFDLDNEPFFLARNFMEYEHSDGFNYVRLNLDRYDHIHTIGRVKLNWTTGVGLGSALTWSDLSWGKERFRNKLHMSGLNFSVNAGPQMEFFDRFFINSSLMAGHSWLYNVQIRHGFNDHKARQTFQFLQWYTVVGYKFRLGTKDLEKS